MSLPNHKRIVYLPHAEYRLITALYTLACDGIHYCIYKEYFDSIEKKLRIPHLYNWYVHTKNAYYYLAISNWCKLFGSHAEPTHYYQLLSSNNLKSKLIEINITPNKKSLKHHLLVSSNINELNFNKYHESTKKYRDRNLIHKEHSPKNINDGDLYYPRLEIAKKIFLSFTLILIKLAKEFPILQDKLNCYEFIYDDFHDKKQIHTLINKSIPRFLEKTS